MKRQIILLISVFMILMLSGQDYYEITFDGEGAIPEIVLVENLTQSTNVVISGTDILHLLLESNTVSQWEMESKRLAIFPNPMKQSCNIKFNNRKQGDVIIILYNFSGKQIFRHKKVLSEGSHTFSLSGVATGSYIISVQTETDFFSEKFVSTGKASSGLSLKYSAANPEFGDLTLRSSKGNKSILEMDFSIGDELRFIGISSGFENDTIFASPTADQTIIFLFETLAEVKEIINLLTGKIWMDRNLGASQAATSSTDEQAYGDLYQWGRYGDGHQIRTSGTTSVLSNSDTPGHTNFIKNHSYNGDWRSPQNNDLWQGVAGINNPCPEGFRLPRIAEWSEEIGSWVSNDAAGAFASPLKLPLAGERNGNVGIVMGVGTYGIYWSSTLFGVRSKGMMIKINGVSNNFNDARAYGFSVRCIKQ